MFFDETEGHDAQLESIVIDALRRTLVLSLAAYPTSEARDRKSIEIAFNDVTSANTVADLAALADNHSAGNVNHWHISDGPGTSYFYLVEGYIAVTAKAAPVMTVK